MTQVEVDSLRDLSRAINSLVETLRPVLASSSQLGGGWPPLTLRCECQCRCRGPYPYGQYNPIGSPGYGGVG